MKLKYVTLTGADESVTPQELAELSKRFPFVEWAILFSPDRTGNEPRYPGFDWVGELSRVAAEHPMNLSAHLCGRYVQQAMGGNILFLCSTVMKKMFQRVQLNMGKERLAEAVTSDKFKEAVKKAGKPVIFGGNYKHINVDAQFFRDTGLLPLFDASGGRGKLPEDWPKPFRDGQGPLFCGYAGGLNAYDLETQLYKICRRAEEAEIWIDMESSLRSVYYNPDGSMMQDKFNLATAENILTRAKDWVDN